MILQRLSIFAAEFTDSDPGISKTSIIEMSWRHWEGMHEAPMNLCVFNMFQPISWNLSTLKPHFESGNQAVQCIFFCNPNKKKIVKFYECHGNITFLYFSNFFGVALYIHGSWFSYTFMIIFLTDERWHTIDNNKWMIHEVIYINMDYIYYIYIISWFIIYGWLADQLVMSLAEWTVRWCSHWNLPNLVICYSSPWKITMLLIGKPSINGPFSMYVK